MYTFNKRVIESTLSIKETLLNVYFQWFVLLKVHSSRLSCWLCHEINNQNISWKENDMVLISHNMARMALISIFFMFCLRKWVEISLIRQKSIARSKIRHIFICLEIYLYEFKRAASIMGDKTINICNLI